MATWRRGGVVGFDAYPRRRGVLSKGKCLLLNRTQASQRGDLGLGESFHSGDSEPFVGPVAPQPPQPLATLKIPHLDGTLIAATGEPVAIGADLERLDRPLMPLALHQAFPTVYVPPAKPTVTVPTDQQLSARAPIQGQYTARSGGYGVQALPTVGSAAGIPQDHLPTASAPATTGQPGAIWAPHHAIDHATMPLQPLEQRAVGGLPHIEAAIFATAGQARSIRAPGYTTDPGRVCATHPTWSARRHIPHLHPIRIAPTGQQLADTA